jgi:orotidine-5'-phosphate decarboxylase
VARAIIEDVDSFNQAQPAHAFGSVGVVLGATLDLTGFGIDLGDGRAARANRPPVLAPGFGHQGARVADARRLFGALSPALIVSESRGLLSAGPAGLADAIARRSEEVRAVDV